MSDLAVGAGSGATLLVSCSLDRTLRLWNAATGAVLGCIVLSSAARSLALTQLENAAFVGLAHGDIAFVQLHRQQSSPGAAADEHDQLRHHRQAVVSVALSMDGLFLVSGAPTAA